MTRGKLVLIILDENYERHYYTSTEFNGDMYIENGHGEEILKTYNADNIKSVEDWEKYVTEFNKKNFGYNDKWMFGEITEEICNCSWCFKGVENLYDITSYPYHSDYMYWLNLTDEVIEVKTDNGIVGIPEYNGAVFCFDEFVDSVYEDNWKSDFINSDESYEFGDEAKVFELMKEYELENEEAEEFNNNVFYKRVVCIYKDTESVAREFIDNCIGLPEWAENYFDYERYGEDLCNDSDCYYLLDSGRVVYYE